MPYQEINNGESGLSVRNKINSMFYELFQRIANLFSNKITDSDGDTYIDVESSNDVDKIIAKANQIDDGIIQEWRDANSSRKMSVNARGELALQGIDMSDPQQYPKILWKGGDVLLPGYGGINDMRIRNDAGNPNPTGLSIVNQAVSNEWLYIGTKGIAAKTISSTGYSMIKFDGTRLVVGDVNAPSYLLSDIYLESSNGNSSYPDGASIYIRPGQHDTETGNGVDGNVIIADEYEGSNVGIGTATPEEKLDVANTVKTQGRRVAIVTITADLTLTKQHNYIQADASANNIIITLPDVSSGNWEGQLYKIKCIADNSGTYTVQVNDFQGNTIATLSAGQKDEIIFHNNNWIIW